jgi:hypothetical protein
MRKLIFFIIMLLLVCGCARRPKEDPYDDKFPTIKKEMVKGLYKDGHLLDKMIGTVFIVPETPILALDWGLEDWANHYYTGEYIRNVTGYPTMVLESPLIIITIFMIADQIH